MRIMYDSEAVAEITSIDASKCWLDSKEVDEKNLMIMLLVLMEISLVITTYMGMLNCF